MCFSSAPATGAQQKQRTTYMRFCSRSTRWVESWCASGTLLSSGCRRLLLLILSDEVFQALNGTLLTWGHLCDRPTRKSFKKKKKKKKEEEEEAVKRRWDQSPEHVIIMNPLCFSCGWPRTAGCRRGSTWGWSTRSSSRTWSPCASVFWSGTARATASGWSWLRTWPSGRSPSRGPSAGRCSGYESVFTFVSWQFLVLRADLFLVCK